MRFCLLFVLVLQSCLYGAAQEAPKQNPIWYASFNLGGAWGGAGGLWYGLELNHQVRSQLFTFRFAESLKLESPGFVNPWIPIPVIQTKSTSQEFAMMYGYRKVTGGHSYSASAGISYNTLDRWKKNDNDERYKETFQYVGMPFEFNIKWFKSQKQRYRIYGIIPVGKPTVFGHSFGFKLFGQVSRAPTIGLAFSSGLGYHKHYQH